MATETPDQSDSLGLVQRLQLLASPKRIAAGYLLAIAVAELLTTYVDPALGLISHSSIMVTILLLAGFTNDRPVHQLLAGLVIAPLIRLLSLSMPLTSFPYMTWHIIISIPLFATVYVLMRVLNYTPRMVGFNLCHLGIQLSVATSGILFGVIEYLILRPEPLFPSLDWSQLVLPILFLFIGTGLMEELVFRGLLQQIAEDALGKWSALLYVTAIFAVLHIGWQSVIDLVFVFVAGGFWGWIFMKTRSIVGITIAHGLTNTLLFLVLPVLFQSETASTDLTTLNWGQIGLIVGFLVYLIAIVTLYLGRNIRAHIRPQKDPN